MTYTITTTNGPITKYEGGCTLLQVVFRLKQFATDPHGFWVKTVELESELKKHNNEKAK